MEARVKLWNHRAELLAWLACLRRTVPFDVLCHIAFFLPDFNSRAKCEARQVYYMLQGYEKGPMVVKDSFDHFYVAPRLFFGHSNSRWLRWLVDNRHVLRQLGGFKRADIQPCFARVFSLQDTIYQLIVMAMQTHIVGFRKGDTQRKIEKRHIHPNWWQLRASALNVELQEIKHAEVDANLYLQ